MEDRYTLNQAIELYTGGMLHPNMYSDEHRRELEDRCLLEGVCIMEFIGFICLFDKYNSDGAAALTRPHMIRSQRIWERFQAWAKRRPQIVTDEMTTWAPTVGKLRERKDIREIWEAGLPIGLKAQLAVEVLGMDSEEYQEFLYKEGAVLDAHLLACPEYRDYLPALKR